MQRDAENVPKTLGWPPKLASFQNQDLGLAAQTGPEGA